MRSAKAIFIKQAKDLFKNPMVLVQFLIFPFVSFLMTEMVAKSNPDISNNMFVSMMAPIFAGMALIMTMAGVIAEDMERRSLRFLVMAGVKPHEYLLGTGGFIFLSGVVVSAVFALIGDFTAIETAKFLLIMVSAAAASIILGASIGIVAKNQQTATAISTPVAVILGFTPMIAAFHTGVANAASFLYTQQLTFVLNDFSASFTKAMLIMAINMAVLLVLFIVVYRRKGLRG